MSSSILRRFLRVTAQVSVVTDEKQKGSLPVKSYWLGWLNLHSTKFFFLLSLPMGYIYIYSMGISPLRELDLKPMVIGVPQR